MTERDMCKHDWPGSGRSRPRCRDVTPCPDGCVMSIALLILGVVFSKNLAVVDIVHGKIHTQIEIDCGRRTARALSEQGAVVHEQMSRWSRDSIYGKVMAEICP